MDHGLTVRLTIMLWYDINKNRPAIMRFSPYDNPRTQYAKACLENCQKFYAAGREKGGGG